MIVVNTVEIFPSDNAVVIELSNVKKYKILLKDYENLPFECKSDSRLENITIDVNKIDLNETNQYFDGDCFAFLTFLARKYNIYRSAISKVAMTDIPKKQLYWKLYFAVIQSYKQQKNTNKFKKNNKVEIEPETFKTLCRLVCDEFEAAGYIDDRRYALDKAKYLKEYKKYGGRRIKEYLSQKGISSDIINEILEDEFFSDEDDNRDNMINLLKKKYGENLSRLDKSDRNDIQKAINMLVRNGYKYQEAKNAVTDFIDDTDVAESIDNTENEDYYDE
ncbi:MAG: recombination regulator RecX [Oscillospiraceae bacterium]|nr:recombination regulator RecX [Oscillospiraceae bacterium]